MSDVVEQSPEELAAEIEALARAAAERELAAEGYWRWLVISKKDIESTESAEVVFNEYSQRNKRWVSIVDFTGGRTALIEHFGFAPVGPGDPFTGLVFNDPTSDAEERLCRNEADILVKLRNFQA